jgi:hypothetical protein
LLVEASFWSCLLSGMTIAMDFERMGEAKTQMFETMFAAL